VTVDKPRQNRYDVSMSRKLEELQNEVLQLPEEDRIRLVGQLIASLDGKADPDAEELWLREAEERYRAYQRGHIVRDEVLRV